MNYKKIFPLVVLAGGEGTRLKSIAKEKPKILTPIGNTSFIEIYIKNIMRLGFNEVIFIIHHGKKEIISYLEKSNNTDNLKYSFLYDGKIQAGTAGALINNVEKLPENFWLTYGDTLLNFDPLDAQTTFFNSGKNSLMTIINKKHVKETPNIEIANNKIVNYNKIENERCEYVDYGALIFKKNLLYDYGRETYKLDEILKDLINKQDIVAKFITDKFFEMGNKTSYNELNQILKAKKLEELWNE